MVGENIKVGLLLDSYQVPRWQRTLIQNLLDETYIDVCFVGLCDAGGQEPDGSKYRSTIYDWYIRADRRIFNSENDAMELIEIGSMIEHIPTAPTPVQHEQHCIFADIDHISTHNPDVIVNLTQFSCDFGMIALARYGVWTYSTTTRTSIQERDSEYWCVMNGVGVTRSSLSFQTKDDTEARVLHESYSQTDKRSVNRNQNRVWWKSLRFVTRKLAEIQRDGGTSFLTRYSSHSVQDSFPEDTKELPKIPGNLSAFCSILVLIGRYVYDKVLHMLFVEQWIVMIGSQENAALKRFSSFKRFIPGPKNIYADPFLIQQAGRTYMFLEEYGDGNSRGRLSVSTISEDCSISPTVPILQKPYHLSYPFVFEQDGQFYLVPESRANRTIDLYRCVNFPDNWEHETTLMKDVSAVDATLYFYNGKWWMFANIAESPGASSLDELFLFFSDDFRSMNWTAHPMNPIVSDARNARPAGRIHEEGGRLIRPSQNCESRYGYGINLNEVVKLSEIEYEEVKLDSIVPDWDRSILATHTVNRVGEMTAIDAVYRRPRLSKN